MKKKIVALALIVSLLAVAIVGGTLAYFTDSEVKNNVFVIGNVDITLTETSWTGDVEPAAPGILYAKNPVVTNVGDNDAWIRVDVTFTDYQAISQDPNAMTNLTGLLKGLDDGTNWEIVDANGTVTGDTITYSYYYFEPLEPSVATPALFTGVEFPAAWGNAKMATLSEDFTITVTANAIQTADAFDSAAEAFAEWGDEIAIEQPADDEE